MKRFPIAIVPLLVAACAGPSGAHKKDVNQHMASQNYAEAVASIDKAADDEYGKSSQVLYYLDKGAVLHFAGRYAESELALDKAEARVEELYTKSATQAVGQFLVNDNTVEYRGEPYEKILLHILRSLNSLLLNKPDEAAVEARKLSAFLARLNDANPKGVPTSDKGDLLARVLARLVYEDAGQKEDVAVAAKLVNSAASQVSQGKVKSELDPKVFAVPMGKDEGELILVHYNGPAARIDSVKAQINWGEVAAAVKKIGNPALTEQVKKAEKAGLVPKTVVYALPKFVQEPYRIVGSKIVVNGKEYRTVMAENISSIASTVLTEKADAIQTRAIVRATTKAIAAKQAEKAAKDEWGKDSGALVGLGLGIAAAQTEVADTRIWNTIAAEIRLGHVHLPAGKYQVKLVSFDKAGNTVVEQSFPDVVVTRGKRSYLQTRTVL
ncbi:MAG: hypothetical protein WCK73_05955 [Deltaproteobacteria bacterium]